MSNCIITPILCAFAWAVHMLINHQSPEDLVSPGQLVDGDVYDFIIAGAGPAGCVLANRLSEIETFKVLLIEAGGEEPDIISVPSLTSMTWNTRLNWNFFTEPDNRLCAGKACPWISGKGLGGGSLHNDMLYNRGLWSVYDMWEALGNIGWGFKDVLPYYRKYENNLDAPYNKDTLYHGVGGPQSVERFPYTDMNALLLIEAFNELGYNETDVNGRHQTGTMLMQFLQNDGKRVSANKAYLAPIRSTRPNLSVVTNVRITKVIINPKTNLAEGVEYVGELNRSISGAIRARKEVIVSCGTTNSPQLLMLSGIGPRDTLESLGIHVHQDLRVGYNLLNHMVSRGTNLIPNKWHKTTRNNVGVFADILEYAVNHKGPLSGEGTMQAMANINSLGVLNEVPDITYYFGTKSSAIYTPESEISPAAYYDVITPYVTCLDPKFSGLVTINSTDPFAAPMIHPWYSKGDDNEILKRGQKFIIQLASTTVLRNANVCIDNTPKELCEHFEFLSEEYFECLVTNYTEFANHFGGTCKMGPSTDVTAVVDTQLRVHNITNLRVVDASIMPIIPTGNTNAVTLMIAEKAADIIKNNY